MRFKHAPQRINVHLGWNCRGRFAVDGSGSMFRSRLPRFLFLQWFLFLLRHTVCFLRLAVLLLVTVLLLAGELRAGELRAGELRAGLLLAGELRAAELRAGVTQSQSLR